MNGCGRTREVPVCLSPSEVKISPLSDCRSDCQAQTLLLVLFLLFESVEQLVPSPTVAGAFAAPQLVDAAIFLLECLMRLGKSRLPRGDNHHHHTHAKHYNVQWLLLKDQQYLPFTDQLPVE